MDYYLSKTKANKTNLPWIKKTPSEMRLEKLRMIYDQIKTEYRSSKQTHTQKIWNDLAISKKPPSQITKASRGAAAASSSNTTVCSNACRMASARAIGNAYSRKNLTPRSGSSSMSVRTSTPSQMQMIEKGRDYGKQQSQRNIRYYLAQQKLNAQRTEREGFWLCQWSNKNIAHEYGNYYNLKNRLTLLEDRKQDMIRIYGADRFLDEYTEMLEECWKFEKSHKNVEQFATEKIETVLTDLENMEWASASSINTITNSIVANNKKRKNTVKTPTQIRPKSVINVQSIINDGNTLRNALANKIIKTPKISTPQKISVSSVTKKCTENIPESIENQNQSTVAIETSEERMKMLSSNVEVIISNCLKEIAIEKQKESLSYLVETEPEPSSDELESLVEVIDCDTIEKLDIKPFAMRSSQGHKLEKTESMIPVVKLQPSILIKETIYSPKTDSVIGSFMQLTKSMDDNQIRVDAIKNMIYGKDQNAKKLIETVQFELINNNSEQKQMGPPDTNFQLNPASADMVSNVVDGLLANIICKEVFNATHGGL